LRKNGECCGNCRHYKIREAYCYLTDELTEPCDNCGMWSKRQ